LIDCAADPRLAEIYEYGEVCIQNDWGLVTTISGAVNQVATIGFLVITYFFFKRSKGGILDFEEEDDQCEFETEKEREINGRSARVSSGAPSETQNMRMRRCPQCNGTGNFDWGGMQGKETCDLCLGLGSLAYPASSVVTKQLPSELPKALRNSDDDNF